jgi:hypothetical protein
MWRKNAGFRHLRRGLLHAAAGEEAPCHAPARTLDSLQQQTNRSIANGHI